jgi:hypothetical protein
VISILDLWMPIALSSVVVFFASFILHMVLKYHRADYKTLPNEAQTLAALRQASLGPGMYVFPYAGGSQEMGTPEMQEKYRQGPVGLMIVRPSGVVKMGKYLGTWFAYLVVVGIFVAYLTGRTLGSGTQYLQVFRVAGSTAFMAYGVGQIVGSIWEGRPWSNTSRAVFDGLLYSLLTGGCFGWLWPR